MLRVDYTLDSFESDFTTTYSQDEAYSAMLKERHAQALEEERQRKRRFEYIFTHKENYEIFNKLPGVDITKFTHNKIKFCFQPSLIYNAISESYKFYCSLRYLARHKNWIIKREPVPSRPLFYKVTSKAIFIPDDLDDIYSAISKVYLQLRMWSEDEIEYRRKKYQRYQSGKLNYLDIDSVDEELYFTNIEKQELWEKRENVLRRMLPPPPKRKQKRQRTTLRYKIL